jgi:predicted kinase
MSITVNPDRKRRPTLVVTRGLPGSGKSTAAIAWVSADPQWRARMNRDDLRTMAHGRFLGTGAQEAIVSGAQHAGVRTALSHGTSVVVDDTNLRSSDVTLFEKIAAEMDADFEVWDFRDAPLERCIATDAQRPADERVGEDRIREMHAKHIAPGIERGGIATTRIMAHG